MSLCDESQDLQLASCELRRFCCSDRLARCRRRRRVREVDRRRERLPDAGHQVILRRSLHTVDGGPGRERRSDLLRLVRCRQDNRL